MTTKSCLYFAFIPGLILLLSCESTRHVLTQKEQLEAAYLDQFKLTYLRQLLQKSYNYSPAVQEILRTDNSGFTEPIITDEDYQIIDSLTTPDNEYLKTDSADGNRRAEGAQGKRPLGFVMQKLTGKWLDSLAKRRLQRSGVPAGWTD